MIGAVDARGERTSRRVIKMSRPSMQHDVGITRTKVVLLDGPLVFDLDRVLTGGLPFAFETDQTMRLGILPRASEADGDSDSDVIWVDTGEPCFAYHVVNCYDDPEDADVVVVDVCKSDGTNALGMARGFDDDADGQGWRPANGCGETREELEALDAVKTVSKNGYVGDDAMGVRDDENAFEAFVNAAFRGLGAVVTVVRSKARSTPSPYDDENAVQKKKKKKNKKTPSIPTPSAAARPRSGHTKTPSGTDGTSRRCGDGACVYERKPWCLRGGCARSRPTSRASTRGTSARRTPFATPPDTRRRRCRSGAWTCLASTRCTSTTSSAARTTRTSWTRAARAATSRSSRKPPGTERGGTCWC